jgi:hypothetical protein
VRKKTNYLAMMWAANSTHTIPKSRPNRSFLSTSLNAKEPRTQHHTMRLPHNFHFGGHDAYCTVRNVHAHQISILLGMVRPSVCPFIRYCTCRSVAIARNPKEKKIAQIALALARVRALLVAGRAPCDYDNLPNWARRWVG